MTTGITALTNIGNGLAANDGTGDALRSGADKINANSAAIVTAVNNIAASQSAGRISYLTKAEMDADLVQADGTLADVTNDPTLANNHAYRKNGASGAGSWGMTIDRIDLVTADIDAATVATAAAQAAAESARDAAIIGAGVYPDEATGRAAVADGAAFKVQGSGDVAAYEYRRTDSTASVLIATYPSSASVSQISGRLGLAEQSISATADTIDTDGYIQDGQHYLPVVDDTGRILSYYDNTGVQTVAAQHVSRVVGDNPLSSGGALVMDYDDDGEHALVFVDANNRILGSIDAAGSGDDPSPATGSPIANPERLRELRMRMRSILSGDAVQLVMACIGDSWTQGRSNLGYQDYYLPQLTIAMQTLLGNAGAGYCGFGINTAGAVHRAANPGDMHTLVTGAWTETYNAADTPDICAETTGTAGDTAQAVCGLASTSAVNLYYLPGGSIRYQWGSGAWTTIDLSAGAGLQIATLDGFPTAAAWTLNIEVLSGTVTLGGIEHQSAGNGIRIHNLGAGGSRALDWAGVDQASIATGLVRLAPNVVQIFLGSNDQPDYTVADFTGYMQTLIDTVRSALPDADLLLVSPCENSLGRTRPMTDYQAATRALAAANQCAYLNLQSFFGDDISEYGYGTTREWINSSQLHPSPEGGRVITDALYRLFTQSI